MLFLLVLLLTSCASTGSADQAATRQVQQVPKARLTYVAIGASDTFGTGADDPQTENWPIDLTGLLGNGVRLINLGIPDIHIHQALDVELPVALDAHADLVTIWLAVNDLTDGITVDNYSHDLNLLITRLQATSPHARIALANVPDLTLLPRFAGVDVQTLHAQIAAYNTAIANIVTQHHVILVDLFQIWHELADHPEYISNDGFHPNALGYTKLAEIFYQILSHHT